MTQDIQTWMDKLELLELCNKYAQGADNPDMDLFFSVFTDDVEMEYAGLGRTYRGLAEYRQALTTGGLADLHACKTRRSTHSMTNPVFEVNGDEATGVVHCVAFLAGTDSAGELYSQTRGLVYHDRYRRVEGRWLISYRRHALKWMMEGVHTPV